MRESNKCFDTPKSARSLKPTYQLTQIDRQIVDPDPGKNYNLAISAGDPHFKMEKNK